MFIIVYVGFLIIGILCDIYCSAVTGIDILVIKSFIVITALIELMEYVFKGIIQYLIPLLYKGRLCSKLIRILEEVM